MKKNYKYWQLKIRHTLNSNTWQTVSMVIFIVFASIALSIWLIWRSLYLPEIKNHASYLASELTFIDNANQSFADDPAMLKWVQDNSHVQIISDPSEFPVVNDKIVADFLPTFLQGKSAESLGVRSRFILSSNQLRSCGFGTANTPTFGCVNLSFTTRSTVRGYWQALCLACRF